jgi:gamma-glutamylcyclotransferase (GGCT)/AIG2-like uncharacterized protein YtfP
VDRDLLDLVVARLDALAAGPDGGSAAAWRETWRLAVAGPGVAPPAGAAPPASATACAEAIDAALGRPSRRLVAYGTLRPGAPNHHLLAGLGTWQPAIVRGRLGDWHGYPILHAVPDGPELPVMLLTAAHLPGRMARLDAFEGPAYRRSWIVAELEEGGAPGLQGRPAVVAQCYVGARTGTG